MSDEETDNVIELYPKKEEATQPHIKLMFEQVMEYVKATPNILEAIVVINTAEETHTFRTPMQSAGSLLLTLEILKSKIIKEHYD